jgi:cleavage stimulation factor subunit 3
VRKTIEGAYEFALKFIGHSRDAGEVWREYIEFLKQRETGNQWQAGQKMDDIRRTYQRAVAIPLMNVEQLWREYDGYENSLNRITAKKFLGDRSAAYMTARSVLREMRPLTDSLQRPVLPRVPCWAIAPSLDPVVTPMTIVRDRHGVELWKKYLKWEEGDPLQLNNDDGDEKAYQTRVLMAYRKASMHMRFYPEIWYLAANFLHRHDRIEEARQWLENGLSACPGSALLAFAIVEAGERHQQNSGSSDRFNALLDWIHKEIDQLHVQLEEKIRSVDLEAEQAKEAIRLRKNDEGATEELEGEEREEARKLEEQREQKRKAERDLVRPKVDELKEYAALVWIKYMHFIRRTEGQRPSRTIFARARKSKHCTWQVFEANALMEYHCSKDVAVATKVFELALKTFGEDEAFVVRYLEFLLSINDDTNARALFERTVTNFTPERARPIWDRWCDYEYSFGDSASIAKLEDRLAQLYPEEPQTKRLLERNVYMDLDIVGPMDLGLRNTGMAAGGASAAERAVAASREGVQGSGFSTVVSSLPAVSEEGAELGAKRVRLNSDRASATPPPMVGQQQQQTGVRGAVIPKGPRGVKRSVSPPSRFVPPPRGEPGRHAPPMAATQPQSTYLEIPEAILNFMAALPHAHLFDGPRFSASDIVECLLHSNLPSAEAARGGGVAGGVRTGRKGGKFSHCTIN